VKDIQILQKSMVIAASCLVLFGVTVAFPSNLTIGVFMFAGSLLVLYQVWVVLKDEENTADEGDNIK
jgi:hypothetical protein